MSPPFHAVCTCVPTKYHCSCATETPLPPIYQGISLNIYPNRSNRSIIYSKLKIEMCQQFRHISKVLFSFNDFVQDVTIESIQFQQIQKSENTLVLLCLFMRIGTYVLEETSGLSPHWNMPSLTQTISDCGTAIEDVIDSRGRRFANHYCCFAVRSAAERMSLFYVGFFNSLFPFNTVPNMDERQINTIHHLLKEKT